jgi:hypothetical protein
MNPATRETMDKDREHELWFTRKDGAVRGPHPSGLISRFLLLGRLTLDDEISPDRENWRPVREFPRLIPEALHPGGTPESRERLLQARLREDERLRERRGSGPVPPEVQDMRVGERRQPEPEAVIRHRRQRAEWLARPRESLDAAMRGPIPWLGAGAAILVAVILVVWSMDGVEPGTLPDCHLPAAPEVNWSYCRMVSLDLRRVDLSRANLRNTDFLETRLDGARLRDADLSYADLRRTRLDDADLRGAVLTGATLQAAVLARADLEAADLSYVNVLGADLVGARLDGAILDRAIWTDGRICATGSVGTCD